MLFDTTGLFLLPFYLISFVNMSEHQTAGWHGDPGGVRLIGRWITAHTLVQTSLHPAGVATMDVRQFQV